MSFSKPSIGNTFSAGSHAITKGAVRVWREIRHQYPAGGKITNFSDFASMGKVPAGTPVQFDMATKQITALTDAVVKAGGSDFVINGFTQEDAYLDTNTTVATATVIYDGELYEYMYEADVLPNLKKYAPATIVFVQ